MYSGGRRLIPLEIVRFGFHSDYSEKWSIVSISQRVLSIEKLFKHTSIDVYCDLRPETGHTSIDVSSGIALTSLDCFCALLYRLEYGLNEPFSKWGELVGTRAITAILSDEPGVLEGVEMVVEIVLTAVE